MTSQQAATCAPQPFAPMLHPSQRPAPVPMVVTLNDGTPAQDDSLAWQQECLSRHNHVQALRWLPTEGRRDYFDAVERREGLMAVTRLKLAYAADWQSRKDAQAAAQAEFEDAQRNRMA